MTIINQLVNNVFKHQITNENNITSINTKFELYNFNVTIDSRYDESKFKNLLIDFDAATQSKNGINQLKTLQQINSTIILDELISESINFVFEIKHVLLINIIKLNTSLKLINFHIVRFNTLFFNVLLT